MPEISVIVPAYNVVPYIGEALASVQVQSFTNFEVLVLDDGSSDATAHVAAGVTQHDPRFRLIRLAHRGLSAARNRGIAEARGEVIAFLDGDDRYDPLFLEHMHEALMRRAVPWVSCALYFCAADDVRSYHSSIHGAPQQPPVSLQSPHMNAAHSFALDDWRQVIVHFPSAWNKLYRRDFIGQTRFDEGVWFEDHTFFQTLAAQTSSLTHLYAPLYLHRVDRAGQITQSDAPQVFDQFAVLEHAAKIVRGPSKPGGDIALARLATRLFQERLSAIHDPPRRKRFIQKARVFFKRHNLRPDWLWDVHLSPEEAQSLAPRGFDWVRARMENLL